MSLIPPEKEPEGLRADSKHPLVGCESARFWRLPRRVVTSRSIIWPRRPRRLSSDFFSDFSKSRHPKNSRKRNCVKREEESFHFPDRDPPPLSKLEVNLMKNEETLDVWGGSEGEKGRKTVQILELWWISRLCWGLFRQLQRWFFLGVQTCERFRSGRFRSGRFSPCLMGRGLGTPAAPLSSSIYVPAAPDIYSSHPGRPSGFQPAASPPPQTWTDRDRPGFCSSRSNYRLFRRVSGG